MIRAALFDLDGTLVQTELLKARSYGKAVHDLSDGRLPESAGRDAFVEVLGQPRREVALYIMKKFGLEEAARKLQSHSPVAETPWQAFVKVRLDHYERMLADPETIRGVICDDAMELFRAVRARLPRMAICTSSKRRAAERTLGVLDICGQLDLLLTADDVDHPKPDPEIDLMAARELGVEPDECLVVEDSVSGVKAAVHAGMHCLAAVSEYTEATVRSSGLLEEKWIVSGSTALLAAFQALCDEFTCAANDSGTGETDSHRACALVAGHVQPKKD